jgi:hypothetical protein
MTINFFYVSGFKRVIVKFQASTEEETNIVFDKIIARRFRG